MVPRARPDYYVWAERRLAEQLARGFGGGSAWTLDDATRPLLPAQLRCPSSPTSTGGTPRCATRSTGSCASGSSAASPASASTSRTRSSRTASSATTRRPRRTTTGACSAWAQEGLLDEPARDARGAARAGARSPTSTTRRALCRRDVRPRSRAAGALLRRGDDELDLAFNFNFVHAASRRTQLRAIVERDRGDAPGRTRGRVWRLEPRRLRLATRWAEGDERKARAAGC